MMRPPSTVNTREARRRWASLAYAVAALVHLVIVWTGASEPAAVVVVALTAARLGMAVIMGAGLRWAWFVAVAMELVVIAFIVFTSAVTGVATVAQLLVFVPLGHPALARRDSWVHRWG